MEEGEIACPVASKAGNSIGGSWRAQWFNRDRVDLLLEIDFLYIIILLKRRKAVWHMAKVRAELFESWHEAIHLRTKPNRQSKTHVVSSEEGHRAPTP